jgi:hypothetical protein
VPQVIASEADNLADDLIWPKLNQSARIIFGFASAMMNTRSHPPLEDDETIEEKVKAQMALIDAGKNVAQAAVDCGLSVRTFHRYDLISEEQSTVSSPNVHHYI